MTILVIGTSILVILILTLGAGSAQEVSSPTCGEEICYVDMFDWADPRDPPPPTGPYFPQDLTVRPGAITVWRSMGSDTHTVTSGLTPLEGGEHDDIFDSQLIFSGEEFRYQFTEEGSFRYFCGIHPWMTGVVTVQGNPFDVQEDPVEDEVPMPIDPIRDEPQPEPEINVPADDPILVEPEIQPDPDPEPPAKLVEMPPVFNVDQEIQDPIAEEFVEESRDNIQVSTIVLVMVVLVGVGVATVILVVRNR